MFDSALPAPRGRQGRPQLYRRKANFQTSSYTTHEILTSKVAGIPKTAGGLGSALTRIKPILAEVGITIERRRGRERWVTIREAVTHRSA